MARPLLLLLPFICGCLFPNDDGNGGGLFRFGYSEQDFRDDFNDVGCEYLVTCFNVFESIEQCDLTFDTGRGEACPDFRRDQARQCIEDVEDATDTCTDIPSGDESACPNVCG